MSKRVFPPFDAVFYDTALALIIPVPYKLYINYNGLTKEHLLASFMLIKMAKKQEFGAGCPDQKEEAMETKGRILVIDDERSICENVEKILAKNNFEVQKAVSADDALDKMAHESFSLLISDIVMPGKNGLELLRLVKKQWPITKVIMMTAYASTDTAMKAIRLGALDYVAKPFTPDELRSSVDKALSGELTEATVSERERETIELIDADMPFDREEVAKVTGPEYVDMLGPSDMPVVQMPAAAAGENLCMVGQMVCDIFKKLGATCKAGAKSKECPQKKAKAKKGTGAEKRLDTRMLIGIDLPFNYEEVAAVTGPEYIMNLHHDGVAFIPYEELKKTASMPVLKEKETEVLLLKRAGDHAPRSVLVIDDEAAVNNNIRKILAKKGYMVDQAFGKGEAIEKITQSDYRLVLLDLKMPGVKGLELLKAIRDIRPNAMLVIITGYASIESAVESARMGAVDFLAKPFTPDEIRHAAENAIRLAA